MKKVKSYFERSAIGIVDDGEVANCHHAEETVRLLERATLHLYIMEQDWKFEFD